ncbi:MAG: hypothetical protein KDN19_15310 [Verrucomicrobiae bacterium]|nr:hypothetical protein [Verrucomicrobiae bacterium]
MVEAHQDEWPAIAEKGFAQGSLNVYFTDREWWTPPDEAAYRQRAREKWFALGSPPQLSFLERGNYIHPRLRVVEINGHEIDGRIYCPGTPEHSWPSGEEIREPKRLDKFDILCGQNLRRLLAMPDPEEGYHASVTVILDP